MRIRPLIVPGALALLLAACATPGDLTPLAKLRELGEVFSTPAVASPAPWPSEKWWQGLAEPQLEALINEALAASPGLRVAQARLRQAEAQAGLVGGSRLPRLDAAASSMRQRYTENGAVPPPLAGASQTDNKLALNLAYDFDFWGVHENEYRAALGAARAAEIDTQAARLLLTTTLARSYVQFDRAHRLAVIAAATLRQRETTLDLVRRRVGAGLDSDIELRQAEAAVASTRAELTASREQIVLLGHQLAALAGAGPERGERLSAPQLLAAAPPPLPETLPAALVGRRPDLVAQRWRVEAALGQADAARARFYPNINLIAFVGQQSFGFAKLFQSGSEIRGIAPAITLPIFDADQLRFSLRARRAEVDAAIEQYNQTLLDAVREVADQSSATRLEAQQHAEAGEALARSEAAWKLAQMRYEKGLASYLTVLAAEGQYLAQQRVDAELRARRHDTAIALIRALGGGLQPQR